MTKEERKTTRRRIEACSQALRKLVGLPYENNVYNVGMRGVVLRDFIVSHFSKKELIDAFRYIIVNTCGPLLLPTRRAEKEPSYDPQDDKAL